jgi:hypothetical protein
MVWQPLAFNPAQTAYFNILPLGLPSVPTRTKPFPSCSPNARAKRIATSTVRVSPTMPRIPETLTINPAMLSPVIEFTRLLLPRVRVFMPADII